MWQLGAFSVSRGVREAAELIIGNLNEDGYLIATDDELMGVAAPSAPEVDAAAQENLLKEVEALGIGAPIEGEADEIADEFSASWDGSCEWIFGAERGIRGDRSCACPRGSRAAGARACSTPRERFTNRHSH